MQVLELPYCFFKEIFIILWYKYFSLFIKTTRKTVALETISVRKYVKSLIYNKP